MYVLYIGNKNYSSWSLRSWLLLREHGIGFSERLIPFEGASNRERFRRFSPSGKVPCLVDGNRAVWDSLAIAEYLAERHARIWPQDDGARAWARCAAAEMHSSFQLLRECCPMNCGVRVRLKGTPEELRLDVERIAELLNEGVGRHGGPYLAGSGFTAVDAFFAPVAFRAQTYGLSLSGAAPEYLQRLLALDSMRAWYAAALQEPWRDPEHEADLARSGAVLEDLRSAVPAADEDREM